MKCPKCNKTIPENSAICPYCHKVILLECPNCHSLGESVACEKCGYIILTKCSKCEKTVSTNSEKCKCGYPVKSSIANYECETDEFASVSIEFKSLKQIKKFLGSYELFNKFCIKLNNLLAVQFKNLEGTVINYNSTYIVNFNKELSLQTSAEKAVKFAIRLVNAFAELNNRVLDEFQIPLNLNVIIVKKLAENLLEPISITNNIRLLSGEKKVERYLKGMNIQIDQYIRDSIDKSYQTDSLYSVENDGATIMFYELLLENYVIPPSKSSDTQISLPKKTSLETSKEKENKKDIYDFKVFDINAKCKFKQCCSANLLDNFKGVGKIVSIRSNREFGICSLDFVRFFQEKGLKTIHLTCSEEMNYRPWGVLAQLFKNYFNLSIDKESNPEQINVSNFGEIINLINSIPRKVSSPENARFGYMDNFCNFFKLLKNCVVIIDGFEYMDDTSIQTLGLYFDKLTKINVPFIFITDSKTALHSKFKGFLRTPIYTEFVLNETDIDIALSTIKEDASDFIQSFYYEKIKENFNGSFLYFEHAIKYLKEKGAIISFEGKLLVKNNKTVMLPKTLEGLIKARLKELGKDKDKDASMVMAYSVYLGASMDYAALSRLGIIDPRKTGKRLEESGFAYSNNNCIHINNYNLVKPIMEALLKPNINEFLAKNILTKLGKGLDDTYKALIMGKLSMFKEEYILLWKNSQFAVNTGDFDAYLKNCLGFLSLINHLDCNISDEMLENSKKEVYHNILVSLYCYSPEKIFDIEKVLLLDAFNKDDKDSIIKLSNLMLQGALLTSNYSEAFTLLHNILANMPNPTLLVDGNINTKFILLSLINIEILFNIGEFSQCVELAKDLLGVLKPEVIEQIKPQGFSFNIFVGHLLETFNLSAFAKIFLLDDDFDEYFNAIQSSFDTELPTKDCICALRNFLDGNTFSPSGSENAPAFSKIIYLILQEFETHKSDPKEFAQNIYQAKLLASDIHQVQIEMFCDLLIGYSYANVGIYEKAEAIYNDILEKSEKSAIFNIITISRYFLAKLRILQNNLDEAMTVINESLEMIQKRNNQSRIMYILFEKLFIEVSKQNNLKSVDIETEEQKIMHIADGNKLMRLL